VHRLWAAYSHPVDAAAQGHHGTTKATVGTMSARGRDPMRDYYEWQRRERRRQRWQAFSTIILFTVAAWAILIIGLAMVAYAFVTFA